MGVKVREPTLYLPRPLPTTPHYSPLLGATHESLKLHAILKRKMKIFFAEKK